MCGYSAYICSTIFLWHSITEKCICLFNNWNGNNVSTYSQMFIIRPKIINKNAKNHRKTLHVYITLTRICQYLAKKELVNKL